MNGVRLLCGISSGFNVYGTKLMKFSHFGGKSTHLMISRVYSQEGRETVWKTSRARRKTFAEAATKPSKGTAISIGQGATAGAAVFGIGALAYYGLGFSNQAGIMENSMVWPQYVRDRVRNTYAYFGGSLILTAAGAMATLRTPVVYNLVCKNSLVAIGVSLAALLGTGIVTQTLDYAPTLNAKHLAWAIHSSVIGAVLAPMAMVGGPIVVRAIWYTAGIVGGLTTIAVCAPSDRFLTVGGPLAMCLGAVFIASIGSAFIPPTTAVGSGLMALSLYGGLIVFSGLMLYDTQRIVQQAETHPLYGSKPYDPINACISIYLDTINIFVRIVAILSGSGGGRKH